MYNSSIALSIFTNIIGGGSSAAAVMSHYAKQHDADLLLMNIPLTYRLVLNGATIGYNDGLRIIEEIYNGVLSAYRN